MKISIAQTRPIKGDITTNIEAHKRLIDVAISHKSDAIFFPELSITGYEPELAKDLASDQSDKRFDAFQKLANQGITIGIGMPTWAGPDVRISMIVFQPGRPPQTYSKQYLHSDELPYFTKGEGQLLLNLEGEKITPAICYESLLDEHSNRASACGATVYLASVAKPEGGIQKALVHYPEIAKRHNMAVLMANCVGPSDNFESVGQSGVWNNKGELLAQLDDHSEGLLTYDTSTEKIQLQQ